MSRCVIVGGGECKSPAFARALLKPGDCVYRRGPCGLLHLQTMGIVPHLAVGDFDSYQGQPTAQAECIALPPEKDDTDTLYAAETGA